MSHNCHIRVIFLRRMAFVGIPLFNSSRTIIKKSDIPVVCIIYAIAIAFLIMTLQLPEAAQVYPMVLISALILVNTLYLIRTFLHYRQNHHIENDYPIVFNGFLPVQFFGVFAAVALYLVLMYFFGYYISTVLYLAGSLLFLKVPMKYNLMTVVVMVVMVAVVFSYFLKVPLPTGLIFG